MQIELTQHELRVLAQDLVDQLDFYDSDTNFYEEGEDDFRYTWLITRKNFFVGALNALERAKFDAWLDAFKKEG
jgi:hypothetical protein